MAPVFDAQNWAGVPFHFWSFVFFVFGSIVGSFLNVCIYRLPRDISIVSPASHCPNCGYSIPWYRNVPLVTWLSLRGKCANCRSPIPLRYFLVELLTGLSFLACWLAYGRQSALLSLVYCLLISGFIVASFIDFEHFIIPDEISLGGIVVGFLCSAAVPMMHTGLFTTAVPPPAEAIQRSFWGAAVGAGLVYGILRAGKLMFGRHTLKLEGDTLVIFDETALHLPNQHIPFEEMFYRRSDCIVLEAKRVELIDRCYGGTRVQLSPSALRIGDDTFNPEEVPHMEVVTGEITVPREAMGLGDVKFMAAIGAFLGWYAVIFSLMASAIIGSIVGVTLIALKKQAWSSRLPYGPYIALAAIIWIFGGKEFVRAWLSR